MEKSTQIIVGVSIGLVVVGITAFVFREKLKRFIAEDLGGLSKLARKTVWDATSESTINELHPKMRPIAREFINKAEEQGIKIRIPLSGGYRSFPEQTKLYNQGRTTPGNIVTKAIAGKSYHNYGLAIDVVEIEPQYGYGKNYLDMDVIGYVVEGSASRIDPISS